MRPISLCLMFGLIALRPVSGTRLSRLEGDFKILKDFIFKELGYVRDEVKAIANRVEILESSTLTHDQRSSIKNMDIAEYNISDTTSESDEEFVHGRNNEESLSLKAEVEHMRKVYSNDKNDHITYFKELGYIQHEVKEISNRVVILENSTFTHDLRGDIQDTDITSYNIGDKTSESGEQVVPERNNETCHVLKAEVEHMRKAYSNDKNDLHKLNQDVKDHLREFIIMTTDVQESIEHIHEQMLLANLTLLAFINGSATNVSSFSDNIRSEMAEFIANVNEEIDLRLNKSEIKMKSKMSSIYGMNKNKLLRFMELAAFNVSESILETESIVNLISTNISEMSIQITNISLELQTITDEVTDVEEKLRNQIQSASSDLEKKIASLKVCIKRNIEIKHGGFYYPCAKNIRLANVRPYSTAGVVGLLEVRHNNVWGVVCHHTFDKYFYFGERNIKNNVNVLCRTFGFQECDYYVGLSRGHRTIWMDNVNCRGTESTFLECSHDGWEVKNCGQQYHRYHREAVWLYLISSEVTQNIRFH